MSRHGFQDRRDQARLAVTESAKSGDLVDQAPEGVVLGIQAMRRGRDGRLGLLLGQPWGEVGEHTAQQPGGVALDAGGGDGNRRLPREDGQQLHVAQREGRRRVLVEHLQDALRPVLVEQRSRGDRARHVSRLLGRVPVEARIVRHVGQRERLPGRVHEPNDALRGRNGQADGARSLLAGGNTKFEPVRIRLEERNRGRLGVEQADGRVDDALEEPRLDVALESPPDGGTPRCRDKRGNRGIHWGILCHARVAT